MSLGATLKSAREAKGLTVAELANELHLKTQIVEDLEKDDFQNITASIYGRGFIKLCAERLGIDPAPLLDEFRQVYQKPSHETAPYGTPEYRRLEELAKARAAANVASAPPRHPVPIVPAEPVGISPRVIETPSGSSTPAVVVSPAVPVDSVHTAPPVPTATVVPSSAPAPSAPSASESEEASLFQRSEAAATTPASPAPLPEPVSPGSTENLLFPLAQPRAATVSVDPPDIERRPRTGVFVPPVRQPSVLVGETVPPPAREKPRREGPGPIQRAWTAVGRGFGRASAGLGGGFKAVGGFFARHARPISFGFAWVVVILLTVWAIVGIRSTIQANHGRRVAMRPPASPPPAAQAEPVAQAVPVFRSELILPPPALYAE